MCSVHWVNPLVPDAHHSERQDEPFSLQIQRFQVNLWLNCQKIRNLTINYLWLNCGFFCILHPGHQWVNMSDLLVGNVEPPLDVYPVALVVGRVVHLFGFLLFYLIILILGLLFIYLLFYLVFFLYIYLMFWFFILLFCLLF